MYSKKKRKAWVIPMTGLVQLVVENERKLVRKLNKGMIKQHYSIWVSRPISLHSIFEFWISEFISNLEKNRVQNQLDFFFEFELDFYCLCSLQKSISKSNCFLNLIFWNWKKFEWHSISQKSSRDRQGVRKTLNLSRSQGRRNVWGHENWFPSCFQDCRGEIIT